MADKHPNILRYMRGIQEFNENDLNNTIETLTFSENIVYRIAGKSPIAGEYRGIEKFNTMLQLVKELSGGTIAFEPKIVLADDRTIMAYGRATAKREGKTLDIDHAYLYRLDEKGEIIEGITIPVDLYAFDAFWS
jgi:ketosteroid isomerase-like protein